MKTFFARPIRFSLLAGFALTVALMAGVGFGGTKPAAASGQPDVVVKFDQMMLSAPTYEVYQFTVTNVGTADAFPTVATGKSTLWWYSNGCCWQTIVNSAHFLSPTGVTSLSLGTLKPGQSTAVFMFAPRSNDKVNVVGAQLTVTVPGDATPSNNTATRGYIP